MKYKIILLVVITGLIFFGCSDDKKEDAAKQTTQSGMSSQTHKVTVKEVLQANAYTYILVDELGDEVWLAVTKRDNIEEGMTLYYAGAMEMTNFYSTDLDRTFESVLFVQTIGDQPLAVNPSMGMPHSNIKPQPDADISVKPVEDGITIAQLFENKKSYDGKSVKIRAKVVKVNLGIMGRNWIHIQDGTGNENNYDLTVTSNDNARVGEVVVVEGFVTLDKDFGSGYKYDMILEDSKVIPEAAM
ncbi:nrfj [hydrocarbon metagenome]|uniref:Nrfj n=1 Tax=hydrocarbon metagenome TaxID=938273 RepID=A0A0W8G136_9ZZZZ